jgi:hypothetical protein
MAKEKSETLLEKLERKISYERNERERLKLLVLEKDVYIQALLDVTYLIKEKPIQSNH